MDRRQSLFLWGDWKGNRVPRVLLSMYSVPEDRSRSLYFHFVPWRQEGSHAALPCSGLDSLEVFRGLFCLDRPLEKCENSLVCRSGGTGRRARFRVWWA